MIQGISVVTDSLRRLSDINYVPVAREIKNAYVQQIYIVDAIDTGAFIQSVDYRVGNSVGSDQQEFMIDTSKDVSVTYSDIVERGRKDGSIVGRWPARRALEAVNLEQTFDALIEDALEPLLF